VNARITKKDKTNIATHFKCPNTKDSGILDRIRRKIAKNKPMKAIFKSGIRTTEKIRKRNAIIFALGSNRCIGELSDAYLSISGYSIIALFLFTKHFLSKERTCAKKAYVLLVKLFFLRKGLH